MVRIIKCLDCKKFLKHKAKGKCKRCYLRAYFKNYNKTHKSKIIIKCLECNKYKLHEAFDLCKNCYARFRYNKIKNKSDFRFKKKLNKIKRKQRLKNIDHNFSDSDWDIKIKSANGNCVNCGNFVGMKKLTMDHIIPISKAPKDFIYTIDDVQPLCSSCNSSKNNRYIF